MPSRLTWPQSSRPQAEPAVVEQQDVAGVRVPTLPDISDIPGLKCGRTYTGYFNIHEDDHGHHGSPTLQVIVTLMSWVVITPCLRGIHPPWWVRACSAGPPPPLFFVFVFFARPPAGL